MRTLTTWTVAIALLTVCVPLHAAPAAAADKAEAPNLTSMLLTAAKEGDVKAIEALLAAGTKVDAKTPYNVTPLFVAALFGQSDAAALLIAKGAEIKAAKGGDGSTALHAASFFCHTEVVKLLLDKGADVNARNNKSETPLDTVAAPWSEELGKAYGGIGKVLGIKVDLKRLQAARPKIAAALRARGGKAGGVAKAGGASKASAAAKGTGLRSSYYKNGRIYVNELGTPEGKPVTAPPVKSWEDFKPSWSKTGDMLVFFRRVKNDPVVVKWKTKICVIKTDGTGFHELTDGTHTDFNQTWTRDGTNTPIWNRRNMKTGGFIVMKSKVGNRPGQEVAITDPAYHNWAYTCLIDGRILVQCAHPTQGWGYFLMTPNPGGKPKYQRLDTAGLASKGLLDRVSVSPSEDKICFEHQIGHKHNPIGRALYVADFDAKKLAITHPKPFANPQRKKRWFAYPRWTTGEKAIVYHASPSLYLYTLADGTTKRVSTDAGAEYRYPHGERMPK